MFQQRQFLPLMGPEEHGFQRIQRGSDRLEGLINGLCASKGRRQRVPAAQRPRSGRASPPHPAAPCHSPCPGATEPFSGLVIALRLFSRDQSACEVFPDHAACIAPCSPSPDCQTCPVEGLAPGLAVMQGEEPGGENPQL